MKRQLPAFAAGVLTTVLVGSIGFGALAASGQMTITVDPINIQVNGETFKPKDAQGNEVPVFAYNGTTYAPLRALAEAYGLEVGYDSAANVATVKGNTAASGASTDPAPGTTALPTDYSDWSKEDEAAYQEFKGLWVVELRDKGDGHINIDGSYTSVEWESYNLYIKNDTDETKLYELLQDTGSKKYKDRLGRELRSGGASEIGLWFFGSEKDLILTWTVEI